MDWIKKHFILACVIYFCLSSVFILVITNEFVKNRSKIEAEKNYIEINKTLLKNKDLMIRYNRTNNEMCGKLDTIKIYLKQLNEE